METTVQQRRVSFEKGVCFRVGSLHSLFLSPIERTNELLLLFSVTAISVRVTRPIEEGDTGTGLASLLQRGRTG